MLQWETKFMIPILGAEELDLHKLFVEVTSRGGLERSTGVHCACLEVISGSARST
ncbi:hypothetical protein C1H46_027145 [Malus baccata]|uniref:ARID domain-containing protein n=1 Tax=Malus baccata TaxID=106549 RepID=A0A540LLI0_MALBA|nr:hypothetical protein C1H46_027145 [Malus baccata]